MAKNTPQRVQFGVQYARIHRAPLDSEEVLNTFSDLQDKVEQKGNCDTKSGNFYAGLYTAVVNDSNASYNGPYYISYVKTGSGSTAQISYVYDKIIRESDLAKLTSSMSLEEENVVGWGRIL